jgi:hypothetical protein
VVIMNENRASLMLEFRQRLRWIALIALLTALAAIGMVALTGPITVNLAFTVFDLSPETSSIFG